MDGRTSQTHKKTAVLILLACAVVLAAFGCLMVGSSGMTVSACLDALLGRTGGTAARIIWGIRIPRLLAALIAGAGLSVSGLLMQTSLGNAYIAGDAGPLQLIHQDPRGLRVEG